MRACRHVGAARAEQPFEPALAQPRVLALGGVRRPAQHVLELAERNLLLGLVARDEELAALLVEASVELPHQLAELVALSVLRDDGEPRLRRPQGQPLAVERQPGREDRVLELVLARGELGFDDAGLARSAQPVEPFLLVGGGCLGLGPAERVELVVGEEIGVPRDDRGLLGRVLLADPDGADLLRGLGVVRLVGVLVLLRGANGGSAQRWAWACARLRTVESSCSSSNGFGRIASASLRPESVISTEPVTSTTGIGGRRAWHSVTSASLRSWYRWTSSTTTSTSSR